MAVYTPDYDYQNGKKLLEELKGYEGKLIRYYVAENEKHSQSLQATIDEMMKVFQAIGKFSKR